MYDFDSWYIHGSFRSVSAWKKHGDARGWTAQHVRYLDTGISKVRCFDMSKYRKLKFDISIYQNFRYDTQHYSIHKTMAWMPTSDRPHQIPLTKSDPRWMFYIVWGRQIPAYILYDTCIYSLKGCTWLFFWGYGTHLSLKLSISPATKNRFWRKYGKALHRC